MGRDLHWAARYQFLEELWQGQDRLIFDQEVEAMIERGGPPLVEGEDQALMDLFDELVPRAPQSAQAWVIVASEARTTDYSLHRGGAIFVGIEEALALAPEEPWQVAIIDLGAGARFVTDDEDPQRLRAELDADFSAFVELLAEGAEEGKTVVVFLPLDQATGPLDRDAALGWLDDFCQEQLPGARIFGAGPLPVAAFYAFGPSDGDDDQEGVAIDFDNRLGAEEPRTTVLMAIAGSAIESDGLTLIELPEARDGAEGARSGTDGSTGGSADDSSLRKQLAEARRATDEGAIARQQLIERLDAAEDRCERLEERLAGEDLQVASSTDGPRLDAALAREQSLRWEVHRLEAQVDLLRARPVEALEAEMAVLRVRLGEAVAGVPTAGASIAEHALPPVGRRRRREAVGTAAAGENTAAAVRGRLDRVMRRLERGGMAAVELHRELAEIRRRVR